MRISNVRIDGFGAWSDLTLDDLPDGLACIYGPNEAGKTTLMQFLRSVLYGFSSLRRSRYLPPARGGVGGGSLALTTPRGDATVTRRDDNPAERPEGRLIVRTPDGVSESPESLRILLGGLDEPSFNNVFAIGLREIQELSSLDDSAAADQLYELSTGLGRVSLAEVLRNLESARERILSSDGRPCQVVQLLGERSKTEAELDDLCALNHRYAALYEEHQRLDEQAGRLEAREAELSLSLRRLEVARVARDAWLSRLDARREIAETPEIDIPDDLFDRLKGTRRRIRRRKKQLAAAVKERREALLEAGALGIHEDLCRCAPRIEALAEQEDWIAALDEQVRLLDKEAATLDVQVAAERERLGIKSSERPAADDRAVRALRPLAQNMLNARERWRQAERRYKREMQSSEAASGELRSALPGRERRDLQSEIERAGNLVAQLRRRAQLDERLTTMARHETELGEQIRDLLDRQVLPPHLMFGLGAFFIVGFVMAIGGMLFASTYLLPILGALFVIGAIAGYIGFERSAAARLSAAQRQLSLLDAQIAQAKEERDAIDAQLPRGGGPILTRLQTAEKELESLESLLALDARRQTAERDAQDAASRREEAEEAYRKARSAWRRGLAAAGLPEDMSPKQAQEFLKGRNRLEDSYRRLDGRAQELAQRRRERDALVERIGALMSELRMTPASPDPRARIHQLRQALAAQQSMVARRDELRATARRLRKQSKRYATDLATAKRRWRRLLVEAGVENLAELRKRAAAADRLAELRATEAELSRVIAAAIGDQFTEMEIGAELDPQNPLSIEARVTSAQTEKTQIEAELRAIYERRGQLSQEMKVLAEDNRPALKRLELGEIEEQLNEALHRWRVLAATHALIEKTRSSYERDRQPEALREASTYLNDLTRGRYRRVWTPLDERRLYVERADGGMLPIELLSRGAREQLFLALRLALIAAYARRGVRAPVIFDDVLVNFDKPRMEAAVDTLRKFAAEGHQVILFTCHEHILRAFQARELPWRVLPARDGAPPVEIPIYEPPAVVVEAPPAPPAPEPEPELAPEPEPAPLPAHTPEFAAEYVLNTAETVEVIITESVNGFSHRDQPPEPVAFEELYEEEEVIAPQPKDLPAVWIRRRRAGPFDNAVWFEPVKTQTDDAALRAAAASRRGAVILPEYTYGDYHWIRTDAIGKESYPPELDDNDEADAA